MNGLRHTHADRTGPPTGLASWYVPGRADGFGDRLLMFDNTSTPALELLRFRHELVAAPGFEDELRERVRRLRNFRHATFAPVRSVDYLDDGQSLALVSEHAVGQRLSELFDQQPRKGLNPGIVTWLLRELVPALAALQSQGPDLSHGALTADRIVLTPEGRLRIVEYVLGSALDRLERPPATLFRDFSVIAEHDEFGGSRLDPGADVGQLASVALSMLLGRPLTFQDVQSGLPALLDEISELATASSRHQISPLRVWLERALPVGGHGGYRSAADAQYDVRQLPAHPDAGTSVAAPRPHLPPPVTLGLAPQTDTASLSPQTDRAPEPPPRPALRSVPRTEDSRLSDHDRDGVPLESFPSEHAARKPLAAARPVPEAQPIPAPDPLPTAAPSIDSGRATTPAMPVAPPQPPMSPPAIASAPPIDGRSWLVLLMAGAILAQSAAIGFLATHRAPPASAAVVIESARAGDTVLVNGRSAGTTPLQLSVGADIKSVRIENAAPPGLPMQGTVDTDVPRERRSDAVKGTSSDLVTSPVAPVRRGGVRLSSPIELKVLENSQVLGSTADGVITLSAGTHQLDLENVTFGYRTRQTVNVRAGQSISIPVSMPDGLISINAQPWANIKIDGKDYGETPLANVKIPIGEHEVVFSNPRGGELRRIVIVKATDVTRVSVTFDK